MQSFAGDPVNPNEEGENEFDPSIVGKKLKWLNWWSAESHGYEFGDIVEIISLSPNLKKTLAYLPNGTHVHADWINLNYEIWNEESYYKEYLKDFYQVYRIDPSRFPTSGNKPNFLFGIRINTHSIWDGRWLNQDDLTTGGKVTFNITDPIILAHTIPTDPFMIGLDTYRLSSFTKFLTMHGKVNNELLQESITLQNWNLFPHSPNQLWEINGYNGHFTDPIIYRFIFLRISIVFTRQLWHGEKDEVHIQQTYPIVISTKYD